MLPALVLVAAVHGPLTFIEDDHPKALAAARAAQKPLFIDFWATWCHSCLSLQRFVLSDAGMKPIADGLVWSSVETERESNKAVVEKYPVDAWPTFLIVDPDNEAVLGRFLGSGTVQDMRAFVQDGIRAYREKGRPADPAWAAQRDGDAARTRGNLEATADACGRALGSGVRDGGARPGARVGGRRCPRRDARLHVRRPPHRDVPVSEAGPQSGAPARAAREGDAPGLQSAGPARARSPRREKADGGGGRGRSGAGEDGPGSAARRRSRAESEDPAGRRQEHFGGVARAARSAAVVAEDPAQARAGGRAREQAADGEAVKPLKPQLLLA